MADTSWIERLQVETRQKIFHGRSGAVKVFGDDVDERKQLSDLDAVERFEACWQSILLPRLRVGQECSFDTAAMRLKDQQKRFLRNDRLLWEFEAVDLDFIAQIDRRESDAIVEQLWYIPSMDANPKLLRVVFDTVAERKAFGELARRLRKRDEALGLELVREFMRKNEQPLPAPEPARRRAEPGTGWPRQGKPLHQLSRGIPQAADAALVARWHPLTEVEPTYRGSTMDEAIVKVRTAIDPPVEFLLGAATQPPFSSNFGGEVWRLADEGEWRRYGVSVNSD